MAYQWITYERSDAAPDGAWSRGPLVYDLFTLWQVGVRRLYREPIGFESTGGSSCWEIVYVTAGSGTVSAAGGIFRLQQGDCLVRKPGEALLIVSEANAELEVHYIRFEFNGPPRGEHLFAGMESVLGSGRNPVRSDQWGLAELFERLLREVSYESRHLLLMAGSCVNQILVAVYRNYMDREEESAAAEANPEESPNPSGGKKDIAVRAARYLEERIFSLKELKEVADALGYSYSYLSHLFREEMGMSLQAYYSRMKVRKAMELLRKADATVTWVAELLHYQSIHSFSKAFKRQTGQSPSEYQIQVWNEKDAERKPRKIEIVYR